MVRTFTLKLFLIATLLMPVALLISSHLAKWLLWAMFLLFVAQIASLIWPSRREASARKARIAAIVASKPAYIVYGSGAPRWLAVPIYVAFVLATLSLMIWEAIMHPGKLTGFDGFLTHMTMVAALPCATLAATATWKALAWHLRSRFPDKLLVFANDKGIGTSDGWVIPYAGIRRIDPCSVRSKYGHDDWVEIADQFGTRRVPVNMSLDPPDEILKQLRDRALAGGADLAPALPNGRPPSVGTQLGYRMGYLPGE